eukprot:scaffold353_cov185-Amphora_coffeaeformis.AAC.40
MHIQLTLVNCFLTRVLTGLVSLEWMRAVLLFQRLTDSTSTSTTLHCSLQSKDHNGSYLEGFLRQPIFIAGLISWAHISGRLFRLEDKRRQRGSFVCVLVKRENKTATMVFCCFEQSYEEEEVISKVPEGQGEAKNGQKNLIDNTDNRKKVSVIVPQGSYPGQALMVRSPDGKQVTQAVVPNGCGPGQSFSVTFPTFQPEIHVLDVEEAEAGCVYDIDRFLTPTPSIPEVIAIAITDDDDESEAFVVDARNNDNNSIQDLQEEREGSVQKKETGFMIFFGGADDDDGLNPCPSMGAATAPPRISNSFAECKPVPEAEQQKVLLVHVPKGVSAGSTIHVEIPGENRTVATTVPEGVKSFHICYTPRPLPKLVPPTRRQMQLAPRPEHKMQSATSQRYPTETTGQQKLLLVRVPPGTRAGTTIHVSVPDEPGRILAAVVPAGGVNEFHVSYEARIPPADPPMRSFLAPTSPYRNHSMGDNGLPVDSNNNGRMTARDGGYHHPTHDPYRPYSQHQYRQQPYVYNDDELEFDNNLAAY